MRPVLHADVICAARVLLCLPSGRRWQAAQELVARAEAADRYRRRLGRTHPGWGNGTLMAADQSLPRVPLPQTGTEARCGVGDPLWVGWLTCWMGATMRVSTHPIAVSRASRFCDWIL